MEAELFREIYGLFLLNELGEHRRHQAKTTSKLEALGYLKQQGTINL